MRGGEYVGDSEVEMMYIAHSTCIRSHGETIPLVTFYVYLENLNEQF